MGAGAAFPVLLLFPSSSRVAAMTVKQMAILTATVVALVVIVTLMKVGLGGTDRKAQGPNVQAVLSAPHLTFASVQGPRSEFNKNIPPDAEISTDGHYDF